MSLRKTRKALTRQIRLAVKRLFLTEVLVLGDSHARVFHHRRMRHCMRGHFFNVFNVGGATASGLANPNSKTQAYQIFKRALEDTRARAVVVMLGEVDTGFVIWYRAKKYNEAVSTTLKATVETYTEFLLGIKNQGRGVVVVGTPLPTIQDGSTWGEVANARKEVTASLRERTDLTLEFNRLVKEFCLGNGIAFVDLDNLSLGPDRLVSSRLINSKATDHHYDAAAYAEILVEPFVQSLSMITSSSRD